MSRSARVVTLYGDIRSPLDGVDEIAWARFLHALTIDDDRGLNQGKPRRFNARTYAGGLGCFGILPQRLVDLKIIKTVAVRNGRAHANLTDKSVIRFLTNPLIQRDALISSMQKYDHELPTLPEKMTRSGALALCHRLGPKALTKWQEHQEATTMALFQRANGLF